MKCKTLSLLSGNVKAYYRNPQRSKEMKFDIKSFLTDEEGLTTVEYAVAGTLIALAVIAAFSQLGNTVGGKINEIDTKLKEGG